MIQKRIMQLLFLGILVFATVATAKDDIESASSYGRVLQTCTKKDQTSCPRQVPENQGSCCTGVHVSARMGIRINGRKTVHQSNVFAQWRVLVSAENGNVLPTDAS